MTTIPLSPNMQEDLSHTPLAHLKGQDLQCAAVLNANARKVDKKVFAQVKAMLPGAVHMTHSLEEAEETLDKLLDSGVDAVFAGGGDGTIVHLINSLQNKCNKRPGSSRTPLFGILPFGTGNALAAHFKIRSALDDLSLIRNGAPVKVAPLRMIKTGNELSPFAGLGVDGMILNDYNDVKKKISKMPLGGMVTGLSGYFAAIATKTLPRTLNPRHTFATIRVINQGSLAYQVNSRGDRIKTFEPGDVMYEGKAFIAAASTISCYGFDLKLFPFAETDTDRFHLRIYNGGPLEPAFRVPQLFSGNFSSRFLHDFLAEDIRMELDAPMPYQVAGDARGWHNEVQMKLNTQTLPVILPARGMLH